MFKYLVIFFISCFIVPLVFSQQNPETVTITTYYPAPFGVYQSLQLYPTNPAPDTCATATDLGKIYYNNSSYQLMLCQQDSTGNINWQMLGAGYWTLNGNNHYPNDNNWNVGIGTTTPQAKLDVAGETKIGNSGLACSVDTAGAMRYNTGVTPARMEYCNGASWNVFVGLRPTYVDNNDRGPATFQQAFNQCKSEGKYLPKAEELLYFIFGGAGAYL
jgi:hypothetical protein